MLSLNIPGYKHEKIILSHLMLDFNGTLAIDGTLVGGIREKLSLLSKSLQIHVVTGNTFGTAENELKGIYCQLVLLKKNNQQEQKSDYIDQLGSQSVISIGNGNNDQLMLQKSVIGISVIQTEGTSIRALQQSDLCCKDVNEALSLIIYPKRLIATLRG